MVKVGISMVDTEGARKNLEQEIPGWDFDGVKQESADIWNRQLNAIQIESFDTDVPTNFYTALYHTMISPYNYQDVDGRYRGMDKQVHRAVPGYQHYSVFSLWDTFRALQPLMSIIRPALAAHWGEVLVKGYEEGGILPKWPIASSYTGCMVGYPAVIVLADLACKDLVKGNIDTWAKAAWQSTIFREDLYKKFQGTRELDLITLHPYYKDKYGYVPADSIAESVSWGMEMAYGDWCTSQLLKAAGDTALASAYMEKAGYYKRYIDPETKLMRGVMGDGSFRTPFNPRYSSHMKSDYTEGNAFQWSFFAPHDMDNFITAIGGKKADGTLTNDVYISFDNGVNWKIGDDLIQLPDYIPESFGAQAFVVNSTLTRSANSGWEQYAPKPLPVWWTIDYGVSTRASQAITSWECPYIYMFGGYSSQGTLFNNIWKGVINRLTFKPLI